MRCSNIACQTGTKKCHSTMQNNQSGLCASMPTSGGIDTNLIGIMGASAGGHLAASLANLYHSKEVRPNFQILFYPVISMGAITHLESRDNLLGKGSIARIKRHL